MIGAWALLAFFSIAPISWGPALVCSLSFLILGDKSLVPFEDFIVAFMALSFFYELTKM